MESILTQMVQSQNQMMTAITSMAAAFQNLQTGGPRQITNRARSGRGRVGGGRGNQSAQKARPTPQIVEVRDVPSQKEVAKRATIKNRIRIALRQMSTSIFGSNTWDVVELSKWFNAACRALDGLQELEMPAGQQREDFFEQISEVALAFNEGRRADDPQNVLAFIMERLLDIRGADSFYGDGHIKIQDDKGSPLGEGALGTIDLPGFNNTKVSITSPPPASVADERHGVSYRLLTALEKSKKSRDAGGST